MRIHNKWLSMIGVAALLTGGLVGCGGGTDPDPNNGINLTPYITRASESDFSQSARILAARDAVRSGATWLSADAAAQYDADFAAIRKAYPEVGDITALPNYDLRSLVVNVSTDAAWVNNWSNGNPATGEKALDDLLAEFAPEKIESIGAPSGGRAFFKLTFGQSLNMVKLADRLRNASENIRSAEVNYITGGGNNITKSVLTEPEEVRSYQFTKGWGDCAAGCINKHQWNFVVSDKNKNVSLISETGTPLDDTANL